MCNLYTSKASAAEIAAHFRAEMPTLFNVAEGDVYPGGPGMVVREQDGRRIAPGDDLGLSRSPQKSKKTGQPIKPKPVNNIADLSSFMWRFVAPRPGESLPHSADRLLRGRGREGRQDPHLVQREGSADLRLGRHVEGQRRMGRRSIRA